MRSPCSPSSSSGHFGSKSRFCSVFLRQPCFHYQEQSCVVSARNMAHDLEIRLTSTRDDRFSDRWTGRVADPVRSHSTQTGKNHARDEELSLFAVEFCRRLFYRIHPVCIDFRQSWRASRI
jgi:hypothetical protein